MRLANGEKRLNAAIGDGFIVVLLMTVISNLLKIKDYSLLYWGIALMLYISYYIVFESCWRSTPGKYFNGIAIRSIDGTLPEVRQVVVRNMLRIIDLIPCNYGVGGLLYYLTKNKQRLGDIAAKTIVVTVESTIKQ